MELWPGEIRLATDEDGPKIGQLYKECDWPDHGADWTVPDIGKWWIVAELEGKMVGAMQMIASKPFGYIGDILVHPEERDRTFQSLGSLARLFFLTAMAVLRQAGVEIFMGIVADSQPEFKDVLCRHGAVKLGHYELLARRTG